jgi:hypothetical protein
VSTDTNPPLDLKTHMPQAKNVVEALPWQLGRTADQRRLARGRQATLTNHVASLLASGWTVAEIRAGWRTLQAQPRHRRRPRRNGCGGPG